MNAVLGMIYLFAGNYVPAGYSMCDGRLLQIADNTPLFEVIGTMYGGDGVKTFALPRLPRLREAHYLIATAGIFPSRA